MGMDGTGFKKAVMWKLHNNTDPGCPKECVGDCDKAIRELFVRSSPMEGHIMVRTTPLYWRKERYHGRLRVTLT